MPILTRVRKQSNSGQKFAMVTGQMPKAYCAFTMSPLLSSIQIPVYVVMLSCSERQYYNREATKFTQDRDSWRFMRPNFERGTVNR